MAPIPNTLDPQTTSLISSLERKQKDIADFQIPRLRSCKGPLATQQQLAVELREDLDTFARTLETLDLAVDDQPSERNRRELRTYVEEFRRALKSMRKEMRAAVLASKKVIDANQLSNREELLRSSAVKEKQTLNEKVTEDALMKANNDVTEALQRTITLMQGELERSVLSSQLLESSTASLSSASATHDTLNTLLSTSKHLITALEKSDWLDRMLILAGLFFFILVVAFILKQRLVDRGLRIALFWTRFLPSGGWPGRDGEDEVVRMLEEGVGSVAKSASEVLGTVSTAVAASVTSLAASLSSHAGASIPAVDPSTPELLTTSMCFPSVRPDVTVSSAPDVADTSVDTTTGIHDEL